MLDVQLVGRDQLVAKLNKVTTGVRQALHTAIQVTVVDLQGQVQTKLSGPVLKARSGRLRNSIAAKIEDSTDSIIGTVAAKTPYAAIQEFGFQGSISVREHMRELTQAFGRPVEPARDILIQAHTRRTDLPERSYLRSTLAENAEGIAERLRHAVQQAIYDEGLAE